MELPDGQRTALKGGAEGATRLHQRELGGRSQLLLLDQAVLVLVENHKGAQHQRTLRGGHLPERLEVADTGR